MTIYKENREKGEENNKSEEWRTKSIVVQTESIVKFFHLNYAKVQAVIDEVNIKCKSNSVLYIIVQDYHSLSDITY